jgi:gamma-F420-2:alpha-L-glutamate ligase
MIGWILGSYSKNTDGSYILDYSKQRILDAASQLGIEMQVYSTDDFEIIVGDNISGSLLIKGEKPAYFPDFILPMMGAKITNFGLAVIHHLEHLGIKCFNDSKSIKICKDKLYSQQIFAENKLPIPKTMLSKCPINVDLVENNIGFPLVVKPISGSQGSGVFLSDNKRSFKDLMQLIENIDQKANLVLQEFISFSKGFDLRVFTINYEAVAGMKRTGAEGDFKANFSIEGSKVEKIKLTPEIKELAENVARSIGLKIGGIDLLFTEDGFKICEANFSPGLKGIEKTNDIDIATRVLEFIQGEMLNCKNNKS